MTAYISVSFSKRKLVDKAVTAIVDTLNILRFHPSYSSTNIHSTSSKKNK
ncbi:MAG: hypothetical protein ABIR66_00560 [Saprospiraceae bacterium]